MSSAICLTMMKALYLGNALWHLGAWYSFVFHTELMMGSYSRRRNSLSKNAASTPGGDDWHHDLLINLGYVNLAPAILAYCRLFALFVPNAALSTGTFHKDIPLDVMALFVLAVAHGSEAYWNFTIGRESGRWRNLGKGWGWITVGDATLTVLNVLALFVRISGNRDDGPKGIWLVRPGVA